MNETYLSPDLEKGQLHYTVNLPVRGGTIRLLLSEGQLEDLYGALRGLLQDREIAKMEDE